MNKAENTEFFPFDFEQWFELSKNDPESFELQRIQSIEEFIESVPEERRQRLRCLQWRIDQVRDRTSTPLEACVAISDMMWDSFDALNNAYNHGDRVFKYVDGKPCFSPMLKPAKVLEFSPR